MTHNPALLSRRELARYAAALAVTGCAGQATPARAATNRSAAPRWYDDAVVIDGCGALGRFSPDPSPDDTFTVADIADAAESGVTAINLTVDDVTNDEHAYEHTLATIAETYRAVALSGGALTVIRSAADLQSARRARKLGFILGFQGATALGPDLEHLDEFHKSGVRIIELTYNIRNLLGDGCLEPGNAGLSHVGRVAVERLNAARILIDVSHCGQRTTVEAIEQSTRPVAITHTGCAALADRPRNKVPVRR